MYLFQAARLKFMELVKKLIILIAKFLIFIGDIVLIIFGLIWKPIEFILNKFKNFKFTKKRIKEKEIYSSSKKAHIPSLNVFTKISLPVFKKPHFDKPKIPKLSIPHVKIRHTKRGRKRTHPLFVPRSMKFKYLFTGITFSFLFLFLPLFTYSFMQSLPNPKTLANQETSQTTKIYDRNKILLYQIYANQNRTNVPLSKIPKHFQEATIAIEDKNFYRTQGVDLQAIARSAIADISGKPLQGGSTITQQLIKTRLLTPERTFERKIKEVILAVWAEQIYTKDQILEMYFNQVPYGGTAWGAEAAAQTYFGKSVENLDLAQSLF